MMLERKEEVEIRIPTVVLQYVSDELGTRLASRAVELNLRLSKNST